MSTPLATISGAGFSVLEDPTGRRARWMRRAGRVVFIVFLAWLLAIVLGGLGLVPVGGIPLTHSLRPSTGPAPLAKLPQPRQPTASDLRPAAPATAVAVTTGSARQQTQPVAVRRRGQSGTAPGQTKTTTVGASHGRSATTPGHTRTTTTASHGGSSTAPGHTTTTTSHGRSSTVPGHTKTTTTTVSHGRSSGAPGKQTK
jgi:hypothetical protein